MDQQGFGRAWFTERARAGDVGREAELGEDLGGVHAARAGEGLHERSIGMLRQVGGEEALQLADLLDQGAVILGLEQRLDGLLQAESTSEVGLFQDRAQASGVRRPRKIANSRRSIWWSTPSTRWPRSAKTRRSGARWSSRL